MSECRSCGAPIEWAHTEKGKRIPLDVGLRADGNVLVEDEGPVRVAHIVAAGEGNRVSHFATCPNAGGHRR